MLFFLTDFGEGGMERDRDRNINKGETLSSLLPPKWGSGPKPGMCPDWGSNWGPLGSWASAQPPNHTGWAKSLFRIERRRVGWDGGMFTVSGEG